MNEEQRGTAGTDMAPGAENMQGDGSLPLRTRLGLLMLLGFALCILALLWRYHQTAMAASVAAGAHPAGTPARSGVQAATPQAAAQEGQPAEANPLTAAERGQLQHPGALPPSTAALAEVEVLAALARDDPAFDLNRGVVRLKRYVRSPEETVRDAASRALQTMLMALDAQARTLARSAAEDAAELAEQQDFPAALQAVESAARALPKESPWAAQSGAAKLQALAESISTRRTEERAKALAEAEEEWRRNKAASPPPDKEKPEHAAVAGPRLAALLAHRDPLFRQEAAALKMRLDEEKHTQQTQQQVEVAALRTAWLAFFERFGTAVSDGDLETAAKMCQPAEQQTLLKGGVSEPAMLLQGCAADVAGIRALYDAALAKARTDRRSVELALRRGRVEGALDGVEGRQLFVAIAGGARVGVKVENITAAGLIRILDDKDLAPKGLLPSLWALSAYENPAEAATFLPKSCANAKLALPPHWVERFKVEKIKRLDDDVTQKLHKLGAALKAGDIEKLKAALEALRPAVAALEEFVPLSAARRAPVESAEKLLRKAAGARVTLQDGVSPTPAYAGLATDQISQYPDSVNKTDVGVQYGLKVGAAGGTQRALLKFDGLEAALGKARVKRATLELYQIDSPQFSGAVIGLFRLKRPWVPDAGTWMSYDSASNAAWDKPGASGDTDAEAKEEAKVALDNRKNVWRSWDVSAYVSDVLSGKAQNLGFLLRVVNGEPNYHARFYPESDLDALKDATLRPRLVLEVQP